MGYIESKLVILKNIAVKEQRVYGNKQGNILPCLRFSLMGFEINYQIKNHSNLIIQRRFFSKRRYEAFKENNLTVNNKDIQLNEP